MLKKYIAKLMINPEKGLENKTRQTLSNDFADNVSQTWQARTA